MRFLYVYFMRDAPDEVRATAPKHAAYWKEQELPNYLSGPFADRSGGLITFEIDTDAEAERLVAGDPFHLDGLLESHLLKRWALDTEVGRPT
jgi:uncharacterized protein YciI